MDGIYESRVYNWLNEFNQSSSSESNKHIDYFYAKSDRRQWIMQILQLHDFIRDIIAEKGYNFNVGYGIVLNLSLKRSAAPLRITGNSLRTAPCPPFVYLYKCDKQELIWSDSIYQPVLSSHYKKEVFYHQTDDKDGRWRTLQFL